MPIPFRDTSIDGQLEAVAWLRIVEDLADQSTRGALFETTVQGGPLGFSFARNSCHDGAHGCRATTVARHLFGASRATPVVLFAAAEEVPLQVFDCVKVDLPCCLIGAPILPGANAVSIECSDDIQRWMMWAVGPPAPSSSAAAILGEIMERADPFEPLERAVRGLMEAFADPEVRTLTEVLRVETVMTLPPRNDHVGEQAAPSDTISVSPPASWPGEGAEGGLAERLWAVLEMPPAPTPTCPPDVRLDWPGDLIPFQRDGVRALIGMRRMLLSDDMGLGKTVQAVAALRILKAQGAIRSCLVVAPASVLDQWRREIARWAPEMRAIIIRGSADDRAWQWRAKTDIALVSYDVLRSDAAILATLRASKGAWDVVVLDEAQRIKNRNDTSEAAKSIPRVRSWALTGTPIENHEEELASIMEFVDHDEGTPRKRFRPGATLLMRHGELQLRRKKADVLDDLPPKLETKLTIPLHRNQQNSYDRAEREGIVYLKSLGAEVSVGHVLELITRLKQVCNVDPRTGESSKLDDIGDRLWTLTAQGHKALVFSQYTSDASGVAAAARHLRAFNPLVLTGDVPPEERSALIDRFKTGGTHKALIISLRAGGLGLNLQEASYVFHLDRWWNPAVERQAEDRTHRLGQTVKVNVIKYTCEDTIEERIDRILERKQALFDRLVDDVSLDLSTRMSREELLGLFGLE